MPLFTFRHLHLGSRIGVIETADGTVRGSVAGQVVWVGWRRLWVLWRLREADSAFDGMPARWALYPFWRSTGELASIRALIGRKGDYTLRLDPNEAR